MKRLLPFLPSLLLTLMVLILCGVELSCRSAFARVEREFYVYDELHELQLRTIITSYEEQTPEEIDYLYESYLRNGSFDLLDKVDQEQSARIEDMTRLCPIYGAPRLAACIGRYELRCRASYMAEIPFVFQTISCGLAEEVLKGDSQ